MPLCCKTVIDLGDGRQAHVVHPIGTSVAVTPDGNIQATPIVDFVHDGKTKDSSSAPMLESLPETTAMPLLEVTTIEPPLAPALESQPATAAIPLLDGTKTESSSASTTESQSATAATFYEHRDALYETRSVQPFEEDARKGRRHTAVHRGPLEMPGRTRHVVHPLGTSVFITAEGGLETTHADPIPDSELQSQDGGTSSDDSSTPSPPLDSGSEGDPSPLSTTSTGGGVRAGNHPKLPSDSDLHHRAVMANPLQHGDSGVERQREVERDFQKMKEERDAKLSATVQHVDDVLHLGQPASVEASAVLQGSLREIDASGETKNRSSDACDRHPTAHLSSDESDDSDTTVGRMLQTIRRQERAGLVPDSGDVCATTDRDGPSDPFSGPLDPRPPTGCEALLQELGILTVNSDGLRVLRNDGIVKYQDFVGRTNTVRGGGSNVTMDSAPTPFPAPLDTCPASASVIGTTTF
jgi:hypothetical protein